MQILASALPGFRDLRAPLTAGYLWLILLWISVKPDPTSRPTNEIAGALYDLGEHAGPIWLGLGVSVCAYLVGAVSQSLTPLLSKMASVAYQLGNLPTIMAGYAGRGADMQVFDVIRPYEERALAKFVEPSSSAASESRERWQQERDKVRERIALARSSLRKELDLPATLLLGKVPNLFNEADRLKAESQLRFSVVPPLCATTVLLAGQAWMFVLAFVPVAILWWQGYSKELEFRSLMLSAFEEGAIASRTIAELKTWVDGMATMKFEGEFPTHPPSTRRPLPANTTDS